MHVLYFKTTPTNFNLFFRSNHKKEKAFFTHEISVLLGFTPKSYDIYIQAFSPKSVHANIVNNNERMEYLGDAVIGVVVADFLFRKYPFKDESFLTDMRSKLVRRESLNLIAKKMGLDSILTYTLQNTGIRLAETDYLGNALESLVGAIYIDKSYTFTQEWIEKNILQSGLVDLKKIAEVDSNARNTLHSWVSIHNKEVDFVVEQVEQMNNVRKFTVAVKIDNEIFCQATGFSKKEAINEAAKEAILKLNL